MLVRGLLLSCCCCCCGGGGGGCYVCVFVSSVECPGSLAMCV